MVERYVEYARWEKKTYGKRIISHRCYTQVFYEISLQKKKKNVILISKGYEKKNSIKYC